MLVDEATASVDGQTERLLQRVVRSRFEKKTVLMVAHRLETLVEVDRVAVLSQGRLAELGTPRELLLRLEPPSVFAQMCGLENERLRGMFLERSSASSRSLLAVTAHGHGHYT